MIAAIPTATSAASPLTSLSRISPGVAKLIVTLSPDVRSYSGTRLVITARAPPVESTVISAAAAGLARPRVKAMSAVAAFMISSSCDRAGRYCVQISRRRDAGKWRSPQNHDFDAPGSDLFANVTRGDFGLK